MPYWLRRDYRSSDDEMFLCYSELLRSDAVLALHLLWQALWLMLWISRLDCSLLLIRCIRGTKDCNHCLHNNRPVTPVCQTSLKVQQLTQVSTCRNPALYREVPSFAGRVAPTVKSRRLIRQTFTSMPNWLENTLLIKRSNLTQQSADIYLLQSHSTCFGSQSTHHQQH